MKNNITLKIRLFGAFRKYQSNPIVLTVAPGLSVNDIKLALAAELSILNSTFKDTDLIKKSAIANEFCVLESNICLTEDAQLAILPPVCGG